MPILAELKHIDMGNLEVSEKDLTTIKVGKINYADESEKRTIRQRCVELVIERRELRDRLIKDEDLIAEAKILADFIIG